MTLPSESLALQTNFVRLNSEKEKELTKSKNAIMRIDLKVENFQDPIPSSVVLLLFVFLGSVTHISVFRGMQKYYWILFPLECLVTSFSWGSLRHGESATGESELANFLLNKWKNTFHDCFIYFFRFGGQVLLVNFTQHEFEACSWKELKRERESNIYLTVSIFNKIFEGNAQ